MKLLTDFVIGKKCEFLMKHFPIRTQKRAIYQFNFDTNEEILENYLGNIVLFGINLPDNRNVLTETAVEKLCKSIKNFQSNDELFIGILHGLGGNFCTGVAPTKNALNKSRELIEMIHQGKKPMLAALNGYTTNFGFQLALICDFRAMEEKSLAGFGSSGERSEIPHVVYKKLVMTVGASKAAEMILTKCTWTAEHAQEAGFSNKTTACGSVLGQCVLWAQSIKTTFSLKEIIEEKSKIDIIS